MVAEVAAGMLPPRRLARLIHHIVLDPRKLLLERSDAHRSQTVLWHKDGGVVGVRTVSLGRSRQPSPHRRRQKHSAAARQPPPPPPPAQKDGSFTFIWSRKSSRSKAGLESSDLTCDWKTSSSFALSFSPFTFRYLWQTKRSQKRRPERYRTKRP